MVFDTLGPFRVLPLRNELEVKLIPDLMNAEVSLKDFKGTHFFRIVAPKSLVIQFESLLKSELFGILSPFSPVTLPANARKQAMIPYKAEYFCFVHPLVGFAQVEEDQLQGNLNVNDPQHALLYNGGYVYFDVNGIVLQVSAIMPSSEGLFFGNPTVLPVIVGRDMQSEGRFQLVTIQALREQGAQRFAWLLPNEHSRWAGILGGVFGPITHGAFAYQMQGNDTYIYFPVVASPAATKKARWDSKSKTSSSFRTQIEEASTPTERTPKTERSTATSRAESPVLDFLVTDDMKKDDASPDWRQPPRQDPRGKKLKIKNSKTFLHTMQRFQNRYQDAVSYFLFMDRMGNNGIATGLLSLKQFRSCCTMAGITSSVQDIDEFINKLDIVSVDGNVEFSLMFLWLSRYSPDSFNVSGMSLQQPLEARYATAMNAFNTWNDKSRDGDPISIWEMAIGLIDLCPVELAEIHALGLAVLADKKRDGSIDYAEFLEFFSGKELDQNENDNEVEKLKSDVRLQLYDAIIAKYRTMYLAFSAWQTTNTGYMAQADLMHGLNNELPPKVMNDAVSKHVRKSVRAIIRNPDVKEGGFSFREFLMITAPETVTLEESIGDALRIKFGTLRHAYRAFKGANMELTIQEFQKKMRGLGFGLTPRDIEDLRVRTDRNGNGTIDMEEFELSFVDHATRQLELFDRAHHRMKKKYGSIHAAYNAFNASNAVVLMPKEMQKGLEDLDLGCSDVEIFGLIKASDADGDGVICLPEFLTAFREKRVKLEEFRKDVTNTLTMTFKSSNDAFNFFDENKDGSITVGELRQAFQKLQIKKREGELNAAMRGVDNDCNGRIDKREFECLYNGTWIESKVLTDNDPAPVKGANKKIETSLMTPDTSGMLSPDFALPEHLLDIPHPSTASNSYRALRLLKPRGLERRDEIREYNYGAAYQSFMLRIKQGKPTITIRDALVALEDAGMPMSQARQQILFEGITNIDGRANIPMLLPRIRTMYGKPPPLLQPPNPSVTELKEIIGQVTPVRKKITACRPSPPKSAPADGRRSKSRETPRGWKLRNLAVKEEMLKREQGEEAGRPSTVTSSSARWGSRPWTSSSTLSHFGRHQQQKDQLQFKAVIADRSVLPGQSMSWLEAASGELQ